MSIRFINCEDIKNAVEKLCIKANKILPIDVQNKLDEFYILEKNEVAKEILADLKDNLNIAKDLDIPICQDTGLAVIFIEIGYDVHINGNINKAINEGVANGYINGLLRLSMVNDPFNRINTNDNTPAIIHYDFVDGDKIKITFMPKGFGSENMSKIKMFNPSSSKEDVCNFIVDTVKVAGANPCPPIIVGVGIGGDFEMCAKLSKLALLDDLNMENKDPYYKNMENELLDSINKLNIGPQGFKGNTTALGVKIKTMGTHIAGLPVAVNIGCHVTRHSSIIL